MHPLSPSQRPAVRPLYAGYPGLHGAIESAIQGVLGDVYADDPASPTVALTVISDFHAFAGDPDSPVAAEALARVPQRDFIAVPESWLPMMARNPDFFPYDRYAMHSPEEWDRAHLARLRESLPPGFSLHRIDAATVDAFAQLNESFVCNFASPAEFLRLGAGFGVLHEGRWVAGCSSYTVNSHSLEFEILTHSKYRRRGLALVTGAALIDYCIERGLTPEWDAAHEGSAVLAERLGFIGKRRYTAFRVGLPAGPPPEDLED